MAVSPHSIDKKFVVMNPEKTATVEDFDATLYERLDKNYNLFKGHDLISCHEFDDDWTSWEKHPNGDEVIILLSGAVTFVLQQDQGNQSIALNTEGSCVIIPKNTWHTAKTNIKSKVLFITPGEATQHKAIE